MRLNGFCALGGFMNFGHKLGEAIFAKDEEIKRLRSEVERLRDLVRKAYIEGFIECQYDAESLSEDAWETSEAKTKLFLEQQ
jgi:hypothetical protein